MPPVMGAAAFLMVEYVGIPYTEIVKHAFLPAMLSYIALFYIVHLEALKLGMQPLRARARAHAGAERIIGWGFGIVRHDRGARRAIYFVIEAVRYAVRRRSAAGSLGVAPVASYVLLLGYAARYPDLPLDEPDAKILSPAARRGRR